jgi:hypothetical protein
MLNFLLSQKYELMAIFGFIAAGISAQTHFTLIKSK